MLNTQTIQRKPTLDDQLNNHILEPMPYSPKEKELLNKENKDLTLEDVEEVLKIKADAVTLFTSKNFLEALSKFEFANKKIHADLEIVLYRALCLFHLNNLDEAKILLEELYNADLKHEYYQVPKVLSIILLKQKKYRDAEHLLNGALLSFKNDIQLLNMLAYTLEHQNRLQEAENVLNKILKEYPENTNASNSLAYIYYRLEKKIDKAFELVRFALSKEPNNPAYLDTYALLLLKKNHKEEAKEVLQKAIQNTPANSTDIFNHINKMLKTNFE